MGTQDLAVVLLIATAALLVYRFEKYCLGDLEQTPDERLRLFNRQAWITLIVLCIPLGGVLYLTTGKWQ